MSDAPRPPRRRWRLIFVIALAVVFGSLGYLAANTRFNFKGRHEGLFLLRGRNGHRFELKNDLFLGDGSRLMAGVDLHWLVDLVTGAHRSGPGETYLAFEWDEKEGEGFVRNHLPGGKVLFTSFSRYEDNDGVETHGLFVGGGVPSSMFPGSPSNLNDTGMAFHDGTRWYHLWCNTNEGIGSGTNPLHRYPPSGWKFLGSRILNRSDDKLALASDHEVAVDGVPLRIEKYAYFTAGQTYFKLGIKITNTGDRAVRYFYLYSDEPWLGAYGTSAGNVGWVADRIIEYEEKIDPRKYSFAGLFDHGNGAIGERHTFTGTANFIEWLGPDKPDLAFIANQYDGFSHPDSVKVPLSGDMRSVGVQWGPRVIHAGESHMMFLAIGMALNDRLTGFPFKPDVTLHSLKR